MPSSAPKMTIPQIREELHQIADSLRRYPRAQARLHFLADETTRRSPNYPRAPKRYPALDAETEAAIRAAKEADPTLSNLQLARRFNTATRCVSYALNGKRNEG